MHKVVVVRVTKKEDVDDVINMMIDEAFDDIENSEDIDGNECSKCCKKNCKQADGTAEMYKNASVEQLTAMLADSHDKFEELLNDAAEHVNAVAEAYNNTFGALSKVLLEKLSAEV